MPIPARLAAVACLLLTVTAATGQVVLELGEDARSLLVDRVLAAESLARGGRSLIVTDPVEASIVRGTWTAPAEGDIIAVADGRTATWIVLQAGDDGVLTGPAAGGYAHVVIRSPVRRIMMLHARGHRHVFVNGERRGGDVYNLGITALPIELKEGDNELLFRGGRGQLRIELREPEAELFWLESDHTKPHVVPGQATKALLAAPVANATTEQLLGVVAEWRDRDSPAFTIMDGGLGGIPPLGVRKLPILAEVPERIEGDSIVASIAARSLEDEAVESPEHEFTLGVRQSGQKHDQTFFSGIDGSVQYYALTPRAEGAEGPEGLILTLHGASVEARSQANAYGHTDFATIVAPTNRRPFGFDWEDWGRLDAMETLRAAIEHCEGQGARFDPERTYLTGHSMGGHGTWQLGAHFAPRFAAIGPSAGWRDFWSYGGAGDFDESDPIGQILNTANNASRTLLLEENYKDLGVYILHGDADDNVPVDQARFMRERLKDHPDLAFHEQPGAGHWWGNQCVDWPPMMQFFEDRSIDKTPAKEIFTTINPAISSEARLFTIHRQAKAMEPTRVELVRDFQAKTITLTTENALAISIRPQVLRGFGTDVTVTFNVDGFQYRVPLHGYADYGDLRLTRNSLEKDWTPRGEHFSPALKGAHRAGPFKHAFNNHMAFVYATGGTPEENAWALAKARYDADTWQYRANGSVDVVPDTAFDPDAAVNAGRNVIVYGCADSHRLWDELLGDAPVRIGRGSATVGDRTIERDDAAAFFVYPRAGTDDALVGVIAGTGPAGRRLADEPRYFISGVGYPDWLLMTPDVLEAGLDGVIGAGFFGPDWAIDERQSGWRDRP
jgi:dienelactone hydrolase